MSARLRSITAGRPARVLALAAVFAAAAASLLAGVLFPMSSKAPVGVGIALIPVAVALAAGTFLLGRRLPGGALLAGAGLAAAINTVLVALAHTLAGAVGDALAYVWLVAYVAVFFPRAALPFAAAVDLAFGAGLLAAGLRPVAGIWTITAITLTVLAAVTAGVARHLRGQLRTDDLTGALNRRGLRDAAGQVLMRRRRRDQRVSLAVIDLDGFKAVNDRQGHARGDALLADAAGAWQRALRAGDVLARVGGDEFVVLMPDTDEHEAEAVLRRLRAAHPAAWTAGVAPWRPSETLDTALRCADLRLYERKRLPAD